MHKHNLWSHNWLVLNINNETLGKNLGEMHGVVYDLGCGVLPYETEILTVADKYIGVDWSGTLHKLHADVVADLNKPLPIDDEVADIVVSSQVIEHLCEPQPMVNEAHRILKSDGAIYITVPCQWWIHEAPYQFFRYTPYGLKYLLEKAGFVDMVVVAQSGFFTMWILKINYFSLRFVRGSKPVQRLLSAVLVPIWFIGQIFAPLLDKLDCDRLVEASGYCVTARKQASL